MTPLLLQAAIEVEALERQAQVTALQGHERLVYRGPRGPVADHHGGLLEGVAHVGNLTATAAPD